MKLSSEPEDAASGTEDSSSPQAERHTKPVAADIPEYDHHHNQSSDDPDTEDNSKSDDDFEADTPKPKKHRAALAKLTQISKKKLALIVVGVLVVLGLALLFTPLGYPVVGRYFTQDVQVNASDDTFRLNVTDVTIELDGQKQEFKGEGPFTLKQVKAGSHTLKIMRQYYEDHTVSFTIKPLSKRSQPLSFTASLKPTGRPVLVSLVNTISGQAVEGATIKLDSAESTTNEKGEATIVLPSSATEGSVTISKDGYNNLTATVKPTADNSPTKLTLTEAGRVYFFSKRTGKLDLYSSNLDGTDSQVILAATGNETDDTSLFVSPDKKWLAFTSTRDGTRTSDGAILSKLFILKTEDKKLEAADEGDASFIITGWTETNKLLYWVQKNIKNSEYTAADRFKIKIYSPDKKEIKLVYSNKSVPGNNNYAEYGTAQFYGLYEGLEEVILLKDYIVYSHSISENIQYYDYSGIFPRRDKVVVTDLDGNVKHEFDKSQYIYDLKRYGYNEVAFIVAKKEGGIDYYEYNAETKKETKEEKPVNPEPLRSLSPDGQKSAWSEQRDGQSVTFVADPDGKNEKQLVGRQGLNFLQWYSDEYILLLNTKDEYALYIVSVSGGEPVKISNIHSYSPNYYNGY